MIAVELNPSHRAHDLTLYKCRNRGRRDFI